MVTLLRVAGVEVAAALIVLLKVAPAGVGGTEPAGGSGVPGILRCLNSEMRQIIVKRGQLSIQSHYNQYHELSYTPISLFVIE